MHFNFFGGVVQEKESNMGFCCRWAFQTREMTVLNGTSKVPLSRVIPRVGNAHLQQNAISDSYSLARLFFITLAYLFNIRQYVLALELAFIKLYLKHRWWVIVRTGSDEYPQSMFLSQYKKKNNVQLNSYIKTTFETVQKWS